MSSSLLRICGPGFLLVTLTACSSGNTPDTTTKPITFNDFEMLDGWVGAAPSLSKEKAHSGRYAVKVQPGIEYGVGYSNLLGQASPSRIHQLTVSGWGLRTGPKASAALVVQVVDAAGKNIFWQPISFSEVVEPTNKWTLFTRTLAMPATLDPAHQLKVYLWRADAEQPAFLDDLTITTGP